MLNILLKNLILLISVDCNSVSKNDIGFSACFPYGVRPCFFDDECKDNLFCGYKNCPASFGNDDANADNLCSGTCGTPSWKGDNYCDDQNNNCGCEWDGGDCCGSNVNTQYCSACECLGQNDEANCCGKSQFKSSNYPNEYFPNDEKTWLLTAPVGLIIKLQFQSFHVRVIESKNIT